MNYTNAQTYSNYRHTGTNRYDLVNTGAVIELIKANSNLDVWQYREAGVRKQERVGIQNHMVRMRPTGALPDVGGLVPELVITNSYDKTKALAVSMGFYRLVCKNGLIVGKALRDFSSRHINFDYDGLLNYVAEFAALASLGTDQVARMEAKQLTPPEAYQLAQDTYLLKSGMEVADMTEADRYEARRLLRANRVEDTKSNAFVTMNVIQENVLRGRRGGYGKLRPVTQIDKTIKLNRFLWDRTLELAQ